MVVLATFALATLASAVIAAPALKVARSAPPKSWEFSIGMTLETSGVTFSYIAEAVVNNTAYGHVYLVGTRSPVYTGSPAFFTGNHTNAGLFIDLSNDPNYDIAGVYSVNVPHVGDVDGHLDYVEGRSDTRDYLWQYSNGKITHQSQWALNSFFLCDDNIGGVEQLVLKYGPPNFNGTAVSPPAGCFNTRLYQNFNIPGGANSSTY